MDWFRFIDLIITSTDWLRLIELIITSILSASVLYIAILKHKTSKPKLYPKLVLTSDPSKFLSHRNIVKENGNNLFLVLFIKNPSVSSITKPSAGLLHISKIIQFNLKFIDSYSFFLKPPNSPYLYSKHPVTALKEISKELMERNYMLEHYIFNLSQNEIDQLKKTKSVYILDHNEIKHHVKRNELKKIQQELKEKYSKFS